MTEHDGLVDLIFSGLSERPVWQTFLQALAKRLGGSASAMVISTSGNPGRDGAVLAPIGLQEQFVQLLGSSLLHQLPFDQPRLLEGGDPVSSAWQSAAGLRLQLDPQRSMWLITRPPDDGGALADDWCAVLAHLQPYLARMMQPYLALAESERRRLIAEYVLETSSVGVILVDEHGAVIHVNAVAEAILADTQLLRMKDGRIYARHQAEQQILRDLIRAKAHEQGPVQRTDCYATMALSRDEHLMPVTAIIRPGPPYAPISAPLRRTAVIVLRDPARRNQLDAVDIERLFKLTPAESRLARLLAGGLSTEEAAAQLGVSKHTVRSQLQSIFAKTGTNRQGELVRMLLSSAATLAQNGSPEETGQQDQS